MPDHPPHQTPLPDSLRTQLEEFRRQLWRTKIAEAAFAGIFGLLVSYLLVFGLDRIWPTPALVRLVILLGGTSLIAVFAPIWLHRWVWRHRRDNQLARLISRKHPGLGDRLLGVVELQDQTESGDTLSPRLRAAAMESVADEARTRKLEDSLPVSRHRRWSLAVVLLFVVAGGALTLLPKAGLNSLQRWLFPLSSTPRYTFTVLENVPFELAVPQGEAFTLDLTLAADSEWQPATGRARYARQDAIVSPLSEGRYSFEFPGQQEPGIVRIEVGDARHALRIIPSLRPTVSRSIATIDYPDYLGLEDRSLDLSTGVVTAVRGSRVGLSIEASRVLASATFGPLDPESDVEPAAMTIRDAVASTPMIPVGEDSFDVPMAWTDDLGLAGASGFKLRIEALPDEPPSPYLTGLASQRVMLPEETIEFEVAAEDDFGIREYGIEWQGEFTRPTDEQPAAGDLRLEQGAPDLTRASIPAAFSPAAFDISPQKLVLRAYAEDYLPDRGRVYSRPVVLYVLSRDEHAQMLKNQFDRAISGLEDLTRRERNLYEENQRLERLEGEELQTEEALERLLKQEQAEREQAETMSQLADQMEELLQQSARNGEIDKDTLKKMAEAMKSMRELGDQEMPDVGEKLEDAGDQKNTAEKSEQDLAEAVEKQKDVLEKMEETISKANEANERFEASTFVSRLKKAAADEIGIASATLETSENYGLRREQLDPADLTILDAVVRQQADTASDVRWIKEDLGHFFARTDKQAYRELLDEMVDSGIDLGLEDVRLRLMVNHGYLATTQARQWAALLEKWAEKLEGEAGSGAGGGGGGGGGGEDEDFEFMLRVMRMVQQEQDIRARTRALETLRRAYQSQSTP